MSGPYHRAIALSCRLHPGKEATEKFAAAVADIDDFDRLIEIAVREETAGFLYRAMAKSDLLCLLSHGQMNRLRKWYLQTARENLLLIQELNRILPAFEKRRIPVAMLKGMPLVHDLYGDVGLRKMEDIDLWVAKEHLPAAETCLTKIGFGRDPVYGLKYKSPAAVVDLHTHFLGADRIRSRKYLFDEDPERTFEKTRVLYLGSSPVRCLQDSDQVIFLWLHAAKHNLGKLIWLVDILNILRRWEPGRWQGLSARARQLGQTGSVECLLFFLRGLLDFRPPAPAPLPGTRPSPLLGHLLRRKIKSGALPSWAPLVLFSPGKGFSRNLRYGIETLFPRPAVLRQIFTWYPYRTNWPLYILRMLQLSCAALKRKRDTF